MSNNAVGRCRCCDCFHADNAVVVKANWRDNPWFPAVLEEERRLDLEIYPER
ncbi:MAG: hypothetical protein WBD11_06260 [Xanthobacteraceae bacterium]